ncbi:MAG: 3,4-dihydroxy-2-butanone-4-phosphate synthase [Haloechinothrix sp.]
MANVIFEPVLGAVEEIAVGRPVVIAERVGQGWEGDLVIAAALATPTRVAFMVRHTSGFICTTITDDDAERLRLPPMAYVPGERRFATCTVTVDASSGVSTGISARDRALTLRLLADPGTNHEQLTRPGHMVPVRVHHAGVLHRAGRPEAASDLARLAGVGPAVGFGAIVSERQPTAMADLFELRAFCDRNGFPLVSVRDVAAYRMRDANALSLPRTVSEPRVS